jgi:Zn-dependent protease with chaperone function
LQSNEKEQEKHMGIGVSMILTAVGAILIWGVNATASGLNIHTIGVILMIVGIVGFVMSLFFWSSWGGFGSASRTTVVSDGAPVVRERETVVR